ncbi:magnesium transporter CorA family protein [Oenococcus sp. UCMA 16435]|nr:magnesium transporter CorA family protein [Oenococcus sp. UCMA 16435]MDI4584422.1 magnesium transporter CorA family protein [Oenococcus sp. UCMA 14587]
MLKEHKINEKMTWYEAKDPNQAEQDRLVELGITRELLFYALDPNESARTEIDQPTGNVLIVFDIITPNSSLAATEPVSMIIDKKGNFYTISRSTTARISEKLFAVGRENHLEPADLTAIDIFINATSALVSEYISTISTANRRRNIIQSNLRRKIQSGAISSLMELETQMIYMLDSLRTDRTAISRLQAYLGVRVNDNQKEYFADLLVENTQAIDMANQAAEVITAISGAYSNLNNQRLDKSLRALTMLQALMAVPTVVTGFYGMNMHLPLASLQYSWIITFGITIILIAIEVFILVKIHFFDR